MKNGIVLILGLIVGCFMGASARTTAEPNGLPLPFRVGQFVKLGDNASGKPLYEVKEVSGDWIRVVVWQKGAATDEQMWIDVPTGTAWIHSK